MPHPRRRFRPRPYTPSRGRFAGRTFPTRWAYRLALAGALGYRSPRAARAAGVPVFTRADLQPLTPVERAARHRALWALALMRQKGWSLPHAAHRANTDVDTVVRYVGTALRRDARGRWVPRPRDRLLRSLRILTTLGWRDVDVTDSRTATLLGQHAAAIGRYLQFGRAHVLRRFRGQAVTISGVRYFLETRVDVLRQLHEADAVSYELYRS